MATSCESRRCSAYSEDIRWRMVWQSEALGLSYKKIAQNLCVDKSTVSRTLQLFHASGSVSKEYPKERAFRKLTTPAQLLILQLVLQNPGIYLREIQTELQNTLLIEVSLSTVYRCLHDSGFTRQKLRLTASQQDEMLRQQYISDISVFSSEMCVFVDETGADRRNALRKYGYSMRGRPVKNHTLLVRERISAIVSMSIAGILDVMTVRGGTDGAAFTDFVEKYLLPQLMPYNGVNPHSVVILDNCSIHHVSEVSKQIEDVGALLVFLPPYSPDLMPIEEAFSKLKAMMPSVEDIEQGDTETTLLAALALITPEGCKEWISQSGVYV